MIKSFSKWLSLQKNQQIANKEKQCMIRMLHNHDFNHIPSSCAKTFFDILISFQLFNKAISQNTYIIEYKDQNNHHVSNIEFIVCIMLSFSSKLIRFWIHHECIPSLKCQVKMMVMHLWLCPFSGFNQHRCS